jgi:hypothetical protein
MPAILLAIHLGSVLVPALLFTLGSDTGVAALTAGAVPLILVLSVIQGGLGAALAHRHLRVAVPVTLHLLAPTLTAWAGLATAMLGVLSADSPTTPAGVESWVANLATSDLTRQYAFLIAGWGWLAALASVALAAFAHRGAAPLEPSRRVGLIAAACTLPAAVLLLDGMAALPSGIFLLGVALAAGELMALAASPVSIWSASGEPLAQRRAFGILWLSAAAALVAVSTTGLALSLRAQSAALLDSLLPDAQSALVTAVRAQSELSTELIYLLAGVSVAWATLAMRGRRVVLSPAVGGMGGVAVLLLLATSIGLANRAYEVGTDRRFAGVLDLAQPPSIDVELATVPLSGAVRTAAVIEINPRAIRAGDTILAEHSAAGWTWRGQGVVGEEMAGPAGTACGDNGRTATVAAPGAMPAATLATALALLSRRGVCWVDLLARQPDPPALGAASAPWVSRLVTWRQTQPGVLALSLVATKDDAAMRWNEGISVAEALALGGSTLAVPE